MHNQYYLFNNRRFTPLFWTQFLGAFNDNVYKNALVIIIMYQGVSLFGLDSNMLVTLSGGIFILPYFIFSATAGQLADKFEKSFLIRQVKILEILVMAGAMIAFYFQTITGLIILLFLMGAQSTLFGPLKYGILPQHLQENELMQGNGFIEMGTFLAILMGTIAGGLLAAIKPNGHLIVGAVVIIVAIVGYVVSRFIPIAEAADPTIRINPNIVTETSHMMCFSLENRDVFIAILAISWFWLMGATFLSQFTAYSKEILHGNEHVVTLLLTMFSVGSGIGSTLCGKLSKGQTELGLVPLGAIGITLFSVDVYFASGHFLSTASSAEIVDGITFLQEITHWRVLVDLLLIGIFGGFYIVPLYVVIQQRSNPHHRARIIAANNIFNALFIVLSALGTVGLLSFGVSVPAIFLVIGLCNIVIAGLLFLLMPEFIQRLMIWTRLRNAL